jgi:hypothetical protein
MSLLSGVCLSRQRDGARQWCTHLPADGDGKVPALSGDMHNVFVSGWSPHCGDGKKVVRTWKWVTARVEFQAGLPRSRGRKVATGDRDGLPAGRRFRRISLLAGTESTGERTATRPLWFQAGLPTGGDGKNSLLSLSSASLQTLPLARTESMSHPGLLEKGFDSQKGEKARQKRPPVRHYR